MNEYKKFTDFYESLKTVDGSSGWAVVINDFLKDPKVSIFFDLIVMLKSQMQDDREIMLKILGPECYECLCKL